MEATAHPGRREFPGIAKPEIHRSSELPGSSKAEVGIRQAVFYFILIKFHFTSCFASQQDGSCLPRGGNEAGGDIPLSSVDEGSEAGPYQAEFSWRPQDCVCRVCLVLRIAAALSPH